MSQEQLFIPIKDIVLGTNMREIGKTDTAELEKSLKEVGQLQPVIVRIKDGKYELVAGYRRFKAMKNLMLEEIAASVKEITDEEVEIIQITENVQRKDVTPMEEAESYKRLLEKDLSVKDIAMKLGKSTKYILQRLSFLNLIPEAQKDLRKSELEISKAFILSREPQGVQKEVYEYAKNHTTSQLMEYLIRDFTLALEDATFDTTIPIAGVVSCKQCPKVTDDALFPELGKRKMCLDKGCYLMKSNAWVEIAKVNAMSQYKDQLVFISQYYGTNKLGDRIVYGTEDYTITAEKKATHYGFLNDGPHKTTVQPIILRERKPEELREVNAKGQRKPTPDERILRRIDLSCNFPAKREIYLRSAALLKPESLSSDTLNALQYNAIKFMATLSPRELVNLGMILNGAELDVDSAAVVKQQAKDIIMECKTDLEAMLILTQIALSKDLRLHDAESTAKSAVTKANLNFLESYVDVATVEEEEDKKAEPLKKELLGKFRERYNRDPHAPAEGAEETTDEDNEDEDTLSEE